MVKFPLMALSVAGISNVKKDYASYEAILKAAVSSKKEVKAIVESAYVIKE